MKRLLPLLLALVLVITAAVPAYATGDGNFDGGGGSMGDGTKTNYWNPGMDGVRLSVVYADNRAVTMPRAMRSRTSPACCSLARGR